MLYIYQANYLGSVNLQLAVLLIVFSGLFFFYLVLYKIKASHYQKTAKKKSFDESPLQVDHLDGSVDNSVLEEDLKKNEKKWISLLN